MAARSCGCEIGAANNAAGVPNTSTAVATVLRVDLRIGPTSSPSAGTITRWMGVTLALERAKSGRIVGFSVREKILRLCNALRRAADHWPPGSAAKGDRDRAAGRNNPLAICLRLSASLSGAQCGEHADESMNRPYRPLGRSDLTGAISASR
jgi:hypothetical protein